jgi:hypothetical protein
VKLPILKIGYRAFAFKTVKKATDALNLLSESLPVELEYTSGVIHAVPSEREEASTLELTFIEMDQCKRVPKSRRLEGPAKS